MLLETSCGALAVAQYVRRWQYNSDLTTTWLVGTPIRFGAEWRGQVFEQWGTPLEFDAPSRLRYSLFAPRPGLEDRPENYLTMTYEVDENSEGTSVAFIHDDPRDNDTNGDGANETEVDNPVLTALKSVAESIAND
jgi:hypothetical protein